MYLQMYSLDKFIAAVCISINRHSRTFFPDTDICNKDALHYCVEKNVCYRLRDKVYIKNIC